MFNFICLNPVGGLRIAYVIVSTESDELQTAGFSAIRDLLDQETAFNRRGAAAGPKVFITDDAAGTINALHYVWPSALHILCQWHTWNAVWRLCNNGNNSIKKA